MRDASQWVKTKGKEMSYLEKLQEYREREIEVFNNLDLEEVNKVMNVLEEARLSGRHIFICGNGGSAATASHYAGDFNKGVNMGFLLMDGHSSDGIPVAEKFKKSDVPLYNFECLSDNVPTMMAVSNDEAYSEAFRYPLSVKMEEGDILIGISGSGNSENILNAFQYAKDLRGTVIAIVGYDGGKMKAMADYSIHVHVHDMQISEDLHMVLDHMMMWTFCECAKKM